MLKQIEGSRAVAEAVAMCRPQVICAYPITPQTHIVEALSAMVKKGDLTAEFLNVESEFAAMSVAIGASATGARAYTATASQGLLYMSEAVCNASGLGLPIVMTVANRAIGAPINIWNDHSDAMSQRDAGWLQLYAETSQEALDLHIQAFRIAEELSVPVMVCMDGFLLTHASERADIPDQAQVDAFLPRYEPRQVLDPADPVSIGAMVGPEAFTEVRYLAHERMRQALGVIQATAADFAGAVRPGLRRPGPPLPDRRRRDRRGRARLGARHHQGRRGRAAGRRHEDRRARHHHASGRSPRTRSAWPWHAPGASWCSSGRSPRAPAASSPPTSVPRWTSLGPAHLHRHRRASAAARSPGNRCARMLATAAAGDLRAADLPRPRTPTWSSRELARMRAARRSGPSAENMLRDLGITASRIG